MGPDSPHLEHVPLDQIASVSWSLLVDGIATDTSFRYPVFATEMASAVDARVLVLRRAEEASQSLEFHTDVRSAKVGQIHHNKHAIWVFYDHDKKLQIRARTTGEVCRDAAVVTARWLELNDYTKRAYAQTLAPGTPVDDLCGAAPCPHVEDAETGRANFAVMVYKVHEIEWLLLSRSGHRRAVSRFTGTEWSSSWVMP